jgi:hypothetical protein
MMKSADKFSSLLLVLQSGESFVIPGSRGRGFTPGGSCLLLLLKTLAITSESTSKKIRTNLGDWKMAVVLAEPVRGSTILTWEEDPVAVASICSAGDLTCAMFPCRG